MSTIDTSTWNPDADLNTAIEGIPLNVDASIAQTWQVIRILMAAFKGDTSAIQALMVPFAGATASAGGVQGFVPAPEAGDENKVLKGDGTWDALSASDIPNIDASKIASGTIDLARLPAGALERLVTVADQAARYALTTADVQLGDTVKQLDTGLLYFVTDTGHLDSEAGYEIYTAGAASAVSWSGITDKPSTFPPSSHTHGSITNDGKLGTASRVVVTDGSKVIGVSSITTTKLGYLTDVTANIQGQINGKADSATTLAGYGITDAKIASGTITLGSSTITPLTSASSLNAAKLTGTASIDTTGKATTAGTADKVANKLMLKVKTGTTEGTDLYTYDGSGVKTLDIKQGSNITLTAAAGSLTIAGVGDTKNTAGSTNSSSKLFLIGAPSQAANPQTYSHDTAYVGTDGCLYSGGTKVLTAHQDISGKADDSAVVHKTGDETVAGVKTFSGRIALTRTQDASGTEDNKPALMVGSLSGAHLEMDGNELMAKASGTTVGPFYINAQGGDVYIGGNTDNYKSVTGRGKGSSTVPVYTDANGIVTACGSSLDVDVSGNSGTATKIQNKPSGTSYVKAATIGGALVNSTATTYGAIWNAPTKNYRVACATYPSSNDYVDLCYSITNENISSATNTRTKSLTWNAETGVLTTSGFSGPLTGNVTGNCSGSSGSCTGNAATATQFSANKSVTLTGDVTGSASSKAGWSISTTVGAITDTQIAAMFENDGIVPDAPPMTYPERAVLCGDGAWRYFEQIPF